MSSYKILTLCALSLTILFFSSCGGGDEEVANAEKPKEGAKTDAEPAGEDSKTPETPVEEELEEKDSDILFYQ